MPKALGKPQNKQLPPVLRANLNYRGSEGNGTSAMGCLGLLGPKATRLHSSPLSKFTVPVTGLVFTIT